MAVFLLAVLRLEALLCLLLLLRGLLRGLLLLRLLCGHNSHPLCRPRSVSRSGYVALNRSLGVRIVLRIVCVLSSDPRFCGVKVTRSQFDATRTPRGFRSAGWSCRGAQRCRTHCRGAAGGAPGTALPRCGKGRARRHAAVRHEGCRASVIAAVRQRSCRSAAEGQEAGANASSARWSMPGLPSGR